MTRSSTGRTLVDKMIMTAFALINKSGKYKTATAESKKGKVQTKVEYKIKGKRDAYQKK